jgi:hypothetical protein
LKPDEVVDDAVTRPPIEIGDLGGHLGALNADLSIGKTVVISGLKAAHYNGKTGRIVEATGGRWAVELEEQGTVADDPLRRSSFGNTPARSPTKRLSLKPENLSVGKHERVVAPGSSR